jgi:hypothetical protein
MIFVQKEVGREQGRGRLMTLRTKTNISKIKPKKQEAVQLLSFAD